VYQITHKTQTPNTLSPGRHQEYPPCLTALDRYSN
jgi:hypothetical protein